MKARLMDRFTRVVAVLSLVLVGLAPTTTATATTLEAAPQATVVCSSSIYWGVPVGSVGAGWRGDCYMNSELANYGDQVKALQRSYNNCYSHLSFFDDYPTLVVDGDFGTRTIDALERVQSYAGIKSDGLYGPTTARKMMQWTASTVNGRPVGGACEYYVSGRW
jgi:peptidoglycan hydrolase-like protein with peptidoglycan-binding domain